MVVTRSPMACSPCTVAMHSPNGGYAQPYGMQPMYGGYEQLFYGMQPMYGGYEQLFYGMQPMYGGYREPYGMQPVPGWYPQPNYMQSTFSIITSYKDADLELDEGDHGDEFTVDEGDTISIILWIPHSTEVYYALDDDNDDYDDDVVDFDKAYYSTTYGTEQWIFEAVGTGTTTIILEMIDNTNPDANYGTFEVEITVE